MTTKTEGEPVSALHVMQEQARRIDVMEAALRWISIHDNVSVAHARRTQRVARGALDGKTPDEVLRVEPGTEEGGS